jgi:hypothetical protein
VLFELLDDSFFGQVASPQEGIPPACEPPRPSMLPSICPAACQPPPLETQRPGPPLLREQCPQRLRRPLRLLGARSRCLPTRFTAARRPLKTEVEAAGIERGPHASKSRNESHQVPFSRLVGSPPTRRITADPRNLYTPVPSACTKHGEWIWSSLSERTAEVRTITRSSAGLPRPSDPEPV